MSGPGLARRMRNYLDRQRACLDDVEARFADRAAGGLGWEDWLEHAENDLARILQLAEEYELLRAEWDAAGEDVDADLAAELRETGARAAEASRRFFAASDEAKSDMDALRNELDGAARGKAMLRSYRAPGGPEASHLDTQA